MVFLFLTLASVNKHYQKIAKYQRRYRRNFFCRYFSAKIIDGHYSSVITDRITDRKFRINEKRADCGVEVWRVIFPTESSTELKTRARMRDGTYSPT